MCNPVSLQPSQMPIHVILNTSFPCQEVPVEYKPFSFKYLTDDDLLRLLTDSRGSFMSNFMARTVEEANKNFRNLLVAAGPLQVCLRGQLFSHHAIAKEHSILHFTDSKVLTQQFFSAHKTICRMSRRTKPRLLTSKHSAPSQNKNF